MTDITRPNCALDRSIILCLYVPGFQRQVFKHRNDQKKVKNNRRTKGASLLRNPLTRHNKDIFRKYLVKNHIFSARAPISKLVYIVAKGACRNILSWLSQRFIEDPKKASGENRMTDITRPNCALDRSTILCLYVPGFQRQVFKHRNDQKKVKNKRRTKGASLLRNPLTVWPRNGPKKENLLLCF